MGRGTHVTFRSVFAIAEFRALWAAEALSQIGDQLARVALAILVYTQTESAALTGLTYALTFVPSFFGGIFLAGLADRFPRREVMVVTDLIRAVLIGLVAIPGIPFAVICVLVAGVSFLQAPFKAAQLALLPAVLPGDHFVVGMGIRTITIQTAHMIGFAGGGVLISVVDPYLALGVDAGTFLVSALIIQFGVLARPAANSGTTTRPSMLNSVRSGASLLWRDKGLRVLLLYGWLAAFLIVYEGLAAPYTAEIGGSTIAIGLILAADPLGSVIGALVFSRWVPAHARPKVLGAMGIASCLPLLGCFFKPGLTVSLILFGLAGALGTAVVLQSTALFTRGVPDHSRSQALGFSNSGLATVQGLSPVIAGLLADQVGVALTVALVGVAGLIMAVPAAITWGKALTSDPDRWLEATDGD